jgi:hypothetical protein
MGGPIDHFVMWRSKSRYPTWVATFGAERHISTGATLRINCCAPHLRREICASGSVGGEGGNILVCLERSPIAVIIDRFAGDRQLFWLYGRDNGGTFGLQGANAPASRSRSSTMAARALRWPSMAESAALVRPRFAASSIAMSICPRRRSRSATLARPCRSVRQASPLASRGRR